MHAPCAGFQVAFESRREVVNKIGGATQLALMVPLSRPPAWNRQIREALGLLPSPCYGVKDQPAGKCQKR